MLKLGIWAITSTATIDVNRLGAGAQPPNRWACPPRPSWRNIRRPKPLATHEAAAASFEPYRFAMAAVLEAAYAFGWQSRESEAALLLEMCAADLDATVPEAALRAAARIPNCRVQDEIRSLRGCCWTETV